MRLLAWRVAGPGGGGLARFQHDLELLLDEVLRRRRVREATGERVRADCGGRSVRVGAAAADAAELHTEEVRERRVGQRDGGAAQRAGWVAAQPRVDAAGVEGVAAGGQEAELVVVAERALAHGAVARRLGHRGQRRGQREQRQARDEPLSLRLRRGRRLRPTSSSSYLLAVGGRHGRRPRRGARHERERRRLPGRRSGGGPRWAHVAAEVADEVVDAQRREQHHHHDDRDDEDARRDARHAPAPATSRTTPPRVVAPSAPAAIVRQPRHQRRQSPLRHRRRRRGRDGGRCHQRVLVPPARALSSRLQGSRVLPASCWCGGAGEGGGRASRCCGLVRGPWLISVVLSGGGAAGGGLPFILVPANLSRRGTDREEEMGLEVDQVLRWILV